VFVIRALDLRQLIRELCSSATRAGLSPCGGELKTLQANRLSSSGVAAQAHNSPRGLEADPGNYSQALIDAVAAGDQVSGYGLEC